MAVIGITGGAGSGKSYVAKLAADKFDMLLVDTDAISRRQTQPGGSAYEGVANAFPQCLKKSVDDSAKEKNGEEKKLPEIDRKKLAEIVFCDEEALSKLNSLTHPYVRATVETLIKESRGVFDHILIESAILVQAGYRPICDSIWCVCAPLEDRKKRLADRGYDEAKIKSVLETQKPDSFYTENADYVINDPDGANEETLLAAVKEALASLPESESDPEDE